MNRILLLVFLLFIIAGCDRTIESEDLGFNPPDEPPAPTALKVYHLTGGIQLTWQVSDTAAVHHYKIYYSTDTVPANFIFWDSSSGFSMSISALSAGQQYYFRVASVTSSGMEGSLSMAVSTRVGVTSVIINNDDEYTSSRQVSLEFAVPTVPLLVQVSEDSGFTDVNWKSYTQPFYNTLSMGDGTKRIYSRFIYNDGSESYGFVSDSIILDTRAIIDSTYFEAGSGDITAGDTITFFIDAGEIGGQAHISFPGVSQLTLYDDGTNGDIITDDGVYSRRYIIPIELDVKDGVVIGNYMDAAGNRAEDMICSDYLNIIILVNEITLRLVPESSSSIRLDWSEVTGDDFISYRIHRDTAFGVSEDSELIEIITLQSTLSYTDVNLEDSTYYAYRIYVYGSDRLLTCSNPYGTTTQKNKAPETVKLSLDEGSGDDRLLIRLTWTVNEDGDFASYQIYRATDASVVDSDDSRLTTINNQSETGYTDEFWTGTTGIYFYAIYVYDKQGLKSESSNIVSITIGE